MVCDAPLSQKARVSERVFTELSALVQSHVTLFSHFAQYRTHFLALACCYVCQRPPICLSSTPKRQGLSGDESDRALALSSGFFPAPNRKSVEEDFTKAQYQ